MNLLKLSHFRSGLALTVAVGAAAFLTFGAAAKADAQVTSDAKIYAVTDFVVKLPNTAVNLGEAARDAVRSEFAKKGKDILPQETVNRQMADLGFMPPVSKSSDLIRLGQALQIDYLVTGEVYSWSIGSVDGGKQGSAILRVIVKDAISGISVNGSAKQGQSGVRTGDVSEATLLQEAVSDAAFHTVREIVDTVIPNATVLNTVSDRALINRGSRSGFSEGDQVLIQRVAANSSGDARTEFVGMGTIISVDPDSSFVKYGRLERGVSTGDKVTRIVEPPMIKGVGPSGEMREVKRKSSNGNQGLVALLILVVILGFLLGQGRGSNTDLIQDVKAEAITQSNDVPGVRISWKRDPFLRGNPNQGGPVEWQVFRDNLSGSPVAVAPGTSSSVVDDTNNTNLPANYLDPSTTASSIIDPGSCEGDTSNTTTATPLVPGTPSRYSVRVVYRVNALDLPGSGGGGGTTGGTTGTTTGGTTGGGTTGTTTGGTTGTTTGGTTGNTTGGTTGGGNGAEYCYYVSTPVAAVGQATALARTALIAPIDKSVVQGSVSFQSTSVRGPVNSIPLEYVVQLSTDPAFSAGNTVTLDPYQDFSTPSGQTISSPSVDTSVYFPAANTIYWRVGVRNIEDNPGPVADATGRRYVWSRTSLFRRS